MPTERARIKQIPKLIFLLASQQPLHFTARLDYQ